MARRKSSRKSKSFSEAVGFKNIFASEKVNFITGFVLVALAIFMIAAMVSYLYTGADDQSLVLQLRPGELENQAHEFHNCCGSIGAMISYYLISRCFGLASFLIPAFAIFWGLQLMGAYHFTLWKWFFGMALTMIWLSVTFAKFLTPIMDDQVFNPGGDHGLFVCQYLENVVGAPGLLAILIVVAICFLTFITSETITVIRNLLNPIKYFRKVPFTITSGVEEGSEEPEPEPEEYDDPAPQVVTFTDGKTQVDDPGYKKEDLKEGDDNPANVEFVVEQPKGEEKANGATIEGKSNLETPINPREPFTNYKFPTLDLLQKYESDGRTYVDPKEQEANKNRIIEVLRNFGVEIQSIKATVGPTITLYEITPAKGVRISKIKNLEDDIALSLAALGIRIIAPMPGKGTIGIEVPNAKPNIVSMLSILNSKKFQESKMELPLALGKTITNEVFMVDLAKIPHLLVAGATGQGKSVGLNAIITSLLYKKHPNELKIVLVDPKKVEFSVYEPIAKHFMACIEENEEEPIITDVQKVVKTLKGLCVLMDRRYDLLKAAGARNIKEYNKKFLSHQLNPNDGHDFMPYIVVIIDEFGDLILTAGKEIEHPITRIAQLARAVGIHMVIATQRPTTNIITGNIKANFPGRIAFKVTSGIDSKTILDRPGAQQLVGRGDMLYLNGNEPVRVQCAFVDTPEVERISNYIAKQIGPVEPMIIPDPPTDDNGEEGGGMLEAHSLDPMFEQVARSVIVTQQGSTSMIQRRFSIGYNRAGRIMDQLEKAGIVGPAQGSKPREVLIRDENSLNAILTSLK